MSEEPERFDEEEVGLILRRAAEVQAGRSMTLAEIEGAAAEAGIEAALVRRAATELRTRADPPAPVPSPSLFGPTSIVFERRIAGRVDMNAWEDVLSEIRRRLKVDGAIEHVGKQFEWTGQRHAGQGRRIRVVVTPRRGHTLVRVEERTGGLAGGVYGGIMGGMFAAGVGWIIPVSIVAIGAPVLIPILLAAWVFASYALARTIYRTAVAARQHELQALSDGLFEVCSEHAALAPGDDDPRTTS
jgi:hypothetical protein